MTTTSVLTPMPAAPAAGSGARPASYRLDRATMRHLRAGAARDILAVGPGVAPFGLMLGITIATNGTGALAGLLGAGIVYGGSAQLATVTLLSLGSSLLAAVLSGAVVNARLMLYGAALEPQFRDQPLWFRLLAPHFIQDQTYLSATARPEIRGAAFRRYWVWLGGLLLAVWTTSVGLGLLVGPHLPPLPHLGLVCVGLFVAMLVPRLVSRTTLVSAGGAAAASLSVAQVAPQLAIVSGAMAGIVGGLLAERRRPA